MSCAIKFLRLAGMALLVILVGPLFQSDAPPRAWATDSHVWGVRRDELGIQRVAGRRLVPLDNGSGAQAGPETWTTRPAQRLEVPGGEDGGVGRSARLRVGADGSRIVAVTADPLRRDWGVSVWSPDGALRLARNSLEVAGDLSRPSGLRAGASGFRLRHSDRSVWYAYEDARAVRTVLHTPAEERLIALDAGGFLAFGRDPVWFYWSDSPPETRVIIHNRQVDDGWRPDTIGSLDIRHETRLIGIPADPATPHILHEGVGLPQPFADYDLALIDSEAGSVLVARRNSAPGTVELIELLAEGDTAWHRHLVLEVMPLTPERAEEAIEAEFARRLADGASYLARPEARSVIRNAIHVPGHLPAVSRIVLTASREVWLKTPREMDGMVVWHSISRGNAEGESRRILLPAAFELRDAFGDHVWGFSTTADGTRIAVGLLLVPPSR